MNPDVHSKYNIFKSDKVKQILEYFSQYLIDIDKKYSYGCLYDSRSSFTNKKLAQMIMNSKEFPQESIIQIPFTLDKQKKHKEIADLYAKQFKFPGLEDKEVAKNYLIHYSLEYVSGDMVDDENKLNKIIEDVLKNRGKELKFTTFRLRNKLWNINEKKYVMAGFNDHFDEIRKINIYVKANDDNGITVKFNF